MMNGRSSTARDDVIDRPHPQGSLDVVNAVELVGHLPELLGPDRRNRVGKLVPQLGVGARGIGGELLAHVQHPRVLLGPVVTSRAKTTAAAGAPPITDAYEPATAAVSMSSCSRLENTTNAPPW